MVCLRRRRCCRSMLGGVVARRVVSSIVVHRPIASSMPSRAREERRPAIWVSPRRSRHSVLARAALARSHPLPVSTPRVKCVSPLARAPPPPAPPSHGGSSIRRSGAPVRRRRRRHRRRYPESPPPTPAAPVSLSRAASETTPQLARPGDPVADGAGGGVEGSVALLYRELRYDADVADAAADAAPAAEGEAAPPEQLLSLDEFLACVSQANELCTQQRTSRRD